ncbi:hypothetical protein G4X40_09770 [Rhodococcus sp. D2-41]|uniref:Uncharacterized protein n=1 Tax=Speluncibacter jeojiensis TaxID=2710754 RepID=A0A9X4RCS9_9ACTN|nr:hypothetical protein [Rhodococcus sp. D2-41]MDG3010433.1 hypothetical protein [Rhodococcus sp. D2-41]MDG3014180.1 hypothetical protein [Corynebacteriales bacterium D3-21]
MTDPTPDQFTRATAALMPGLKDDLCRLVTLPSVAAEGYPHDTDDAVVAMAAFVREFALRKAGDR